MERIPANLIVRVFTAIRQPSRPNAARSLGKPKQALRRGSSNNAIGKRVLCQECKPPGTEVGFLEGPGEVAEVQITAAILVGRQVAELGQSSASCGLQKLKEVSNTAATRVIALTTTRSRDGTAVPLSPGQRRIA
jgi:hypothetical protein